MWGKGQREDTDLKKDRIKLRRGLDNQKSAKGNRKQGNFESYLAKYFSIASRHQETETGVKKLPQRPALLREQKTQVLVCSLTVNDSTGFQSSCSAVRRTSVSIPYAAMLNSSPSSARPTL